MKRLIYGYMSGLSFFIAGNLVEVHSGLWGWWDVLAFAFMTVGFGLMDAHARASRG